MTPVQLLKVLAVVAMLAVGQVLFKIAAEQMRVGSLRETLVSLAQSPQLILALAIYGVATLLWVLVLREVPLSRAYPMVALSMVIVPVLGLLLFKERLSFSLVGGGILMLAGAYLIALR